MSEPRSVSPSRRAPARAPRAVTERLKAERIQSQIKRLPGWHLVLDDTAIFRVFTVPSLRAAALLTGLVAEVARGDAQDVEITVRDTAVTVSLSTPQAGGLTQRDFDLAARLGFPA